MIYDKNIDNTFYYIIYFNEYPILNYKLSYINHYRNDDLKMHLKEEKIFIMIKAKNYLDIKEFSILEKEILKLF